MKFKDILVYINQIKENGKKYYTNYYAFDSMSDFQTIKDKESIVFFIKEEFYWRTYYFTSNLEELMKLFTSVKGMMVVDIVCQGSIRQEEQKTLEQAGFSEYAVYCKRQYVLRENGLTEKDKGVFDDFYNPCFFQFARSEDVQEIKNLLYSVFDPVAAHIPSEEKLIEMIQNQNVVCYKINDRIVTLHVFSIQGKKLYSNISYNVASADILYSMERRAREMAYEEYGVKWVYAWYDMSNEKALRRSVYVDTGQRNYIYVKEK